MTAHEIFDIWAPADAMWSRWVKPVLFAHMDSTRIDPLPVQPLDTPWVPSPDGQATIIADLPIAAGVWFGLALARIGYRPVPLYNAVSGSAALVDVQPIIAALKSATEILAGVCLSRDAPPVFLLDARRRIGESRSAPGMFDNRSVSFPTDFPGANFMINGGIRRALLVQCAALQPQPDLAHMLLRWQEAGMLIESKSLAGGPPERCVIAKPPWYRSIFYRLISLTGLRRNALGGFGGVIPEPSSSG